VAPRGEDGQRDRSGATARRASTPDDRWQRGRAARLSSGGSGGAIIFGCVVFEGGGLPRQHFFFYPTRRVYLPRNS